MVGLDAAVTWVGVRNVLNHAKMLRTAPPVKSSLAQEARRTGRETLVPWATLKEVGGFRIFG